MVRRIFQTCSGVADVHEHEFEQNQDGSMDGLLS